jgi:hypothetical protein
MKKEISLITQELFHKHSLEEVSFNELESFIIKYPYVSVARYLLARKRKDTDPGKLHEEIITGALYFNNPLWYHRQVNHEEDDAETETLTEIEDHSEVDRQSETLDIRKVNNPVVVNNESGDDSPIVFQSYHTIDYFASQGIRLQQADLAKDKLGQQLKSFTEWLRSMKKLPAEGDTVRTPEDENRQELVIKNAAHSIEEKEVLTEAMAEVWAKQGNREKATDIYNKLSLLNPSKSAYFAAKIDQLK